jgi:hypothetical protein
MGQVSWGPSLGKLSFPKGNIYDVHEVKTASSRGSSLWFNNQQHPIQLDTENYEAYKIVIQKQLHNKVYIHSENKLALQL